MTVTALTSEIQPAADPHRAWLDRLAELHRQAAREPDDAANELLMSEALDLERSIALTPANTIAGAAVQIEMALLLLYRDGAEGTVQCALNTALATLAWPPPENVDNEPRRRLAGVLDTMTRKVELLTELAEELVTDARGGP